MRMRSICAPALRLTAYVFQISVAIYYVWTRLSISLKVHMWINPAISAAAGNFSSGEKAIEMNQSLNCPPRGVLRTPTSLPSATWHIRTHVSRPAERIYLLSEVNRLQQDDEEVNRFVAAPLPPIHFPGLTAAITSFPAGVSWCTIPSKWR